MTHRERPHWTFTDGTTLPVGTMYCIGRNYAAHAREMNAVVPDKPLVFLKPPAAYVADGSVVSLPMWSDNVHHEVELVVVMRNNAEGAIAVAGVGVGLDLTARDVQTEAKKRGEPWAVAKGWRGSAPVSHIVPASAAGKGPWLIDLSINGVLRQRGSTSNMERTIEELVSYVDDVFSLQEGDCIFTGTPEGVDRCHAGDSAVARLCVAVQDSVDESDSDSINVLASLSLSFA